MRAARFAPRAVFFKFAFSQLAVYSKNSSNGILSSPACGGLGSGGQKIWAVPNRKFQTAKEPETNRLEPYFGRAKEIFYQFFNHKVENNY